MNYIEIYFLKIIRKIYTKIFAVQQSQNFISCEKDPDKASQIIYNYLTDDKPCMITRFGASELIMLTNYYGIKHHDKNILRYIKGESIPWWWEQNRMDQMQRWAGFFPPSEDKIEMFCKLMIKDIKEIDILGSWLRDEVYFKDYIKNVAKISLLLLEPYTSKNPWSRCLKGEKVLVVHPFAELIEEQYKKRTFLFKNADVLPEFNLQTIKAVQSIGGESHGFSDWFEALKWMEDEIDKRDYDICLIGCGAYGFPLAAHVKQMGKKSVHLGGALQLLFGIKGKRWENPDYLSDDLLPKDIYLNMFNDYWVKPSEGLKPKNANKVENGCYW